MKKALLSFLLFTSIACLLHAQAIHIIPGPGPQYDYVNGAVGNGGQLFNYAGMPIEYNNSLCVLYNPLVTDLQFNSQGPFHIGVYNGGDSIHMVPNPDNGVGYVYQSTPIVFTGKLYIQYQNASNVYQVGVFDGTSLTLIPNPDAATYGYTGFPIIYNNNLYIQYQEDNNKSLLARINTNNTITTIPNPDGSPYGYEGDPIVYNGKLYINYFENQINGNNLYPDVLAYYDGTTLTLTSNPDGTQYGYQGDPIIFNNKLYGLYVTNTPPDANTTYNRLMQYDGTGNPTLIPNPTGDANTGFTGFSIVYNNNLYFRYATTTNRELAKFDGTSISLIPNPDATTSGFLRDNPVIYDNKLCLCYKNVAGIKQLATYTSGGSLTLVPNPDATLNGYADSTPAIVYGTNLYYQYQNAQGLYQLGYYNDTSMTLIPNPVGQYNGYPILYNNDLYLQFGDAQYSGFGNLAYFDQSALPVTLLKFTAAAKDNTTLLQWQTANEINNKEFEVQRATDNFTFTTIGTVKSAVFANNASYSFVDKSPAQGTNYYRLKQVDNDGKFNYSKTLSVSFINGSTLFAVYPNPAINTIQVMIPAWHDASYLSIYDMNGKQVMQEQAGANATSKQLEIGRLASGVYNIVITQGTSSRSLQLYKK